MAGGTVIRPCLKTSSDTATQWRVAPSGSSVIFSWAVVRAFRASPGVISEFGMGVVIPDAGIRRDAWKVDAAESELSDRGGVGVDSLYLTD